MLTPAQYEAVGRLALQFNEIEYVFEVYLTYLLQTPEWEIAELLIEEGTFSRKAERFVRVLKAIAKRRPETDAWIATALPLAAKAKKLAEKRNRYVHALVVDDIQTKETKLRMRGREVICDEAEITDIVRQVQKLVDDMHAAFGDLIAVVGEIREAK